jgi:hypothetical protein
VLISAASSLVWVRLAVIPNCSKASPFSDAVIGESGRSGNAWSFFCSSSTRGSSTARSRTGSDQDPPRRSTNVRQASKQMSSPPVGWRSFIQHLQKCECLFCLWAIKLRQAPGGAAHFFCSKTTHLRCPPPPPPRRISIKNRCQSAACPQERLAGRPGRLSVATGWSWTRGRSRSRTVFAAAQGCWGSSSASPSTGPVDL